MRRPDCQEDVRLQHLTDWFFESDKAAWAHRTEVRTAGRYGAANPNRKRFATSFMMVIVPGIGACNTENGDITAHHALLASDPSIQAVSGVAIVDPMHLDVLFATAESTVWVNPCIDYLHPFSKFNMPIQSLETNCKC